MRLHSSLIEKLIRVYSTYGGHREEKKLREELLKLDVSTYSRESGEKILVETAELQKAATKLT